MLIVFLIVYRKKNSSFMQRIVRTNQNLNFFEMNYTRPLCYR